jgi:hypothetical protein
VGKKGTGFMTTEQLSDVLKKRQQLEAKVIARAWQDEEFRRLLVSEPRKAIEQVYGRALPKGLDVRVIEEAPAAFHMILPANPGASQELSSEALAQVAGGVAQLSGVTGIKGESQGDEGHKTWISI